MKKIALFIALTMLATSLFAIGVYAVDGAKADAVPANYGVLADLNPEAIVEDVNGIVGDQAAVEITGSKGITSIAAHSSAGADQVSVTLVEENGEKFLRLTNAAHFSGKYSQLYLNLDTSVFTAPEEMYFTLTFRLSSAYACTDSNNRALLARLVDGVQNNCVLINRDELAANDYSQWTTLTFTFTPNNAPYVMRIITFCESTDYVDVKDFKVYAASAAPATEAPATEAPATEAPATDAPIVTTAAPADPEPTPSTGDYTFVLLAACFVAIAAVAVLTKKKVGN